MIGVAHRVLKNFSEAICELCRAAEATSLDGSLLR